MNQFGQLVQALQEMHDDQESRHLAQMIQNAITILQKDGEPHLLSNKAVSVLEEVSENTALQSYERSELLNIISRLESI